MPEDAGSGVVNAEETVGADVTVVVTETEVELVTVLNRPPVSCC